jgi:tetratricopeptide (TPR) repeat protein
MEVMKYDEAITLMDSLLSRTDLNQPERRSMLYNLGVVYHAKGDQDKAAEYWKDSFAITLTEDEVLRDVDAVDCAAATSMNLGSYYFMKKEYEKATAYLEAAEALDPEDGEIYFNLAVALAYLGRDGDSARRLEKAAEKGIEKAKEILERRKRKETDKLDRTSGSEGKAS